MSTRYILGIDGGATSTICVIADIQGQILSFGHGGPSNHVYGREGKRRLRRALTDSIGECFRNFGRSERFASVVLGMTGIHEGTVQSKLAEQYATELVNTDRILVYNDARIALVGALGRVQGAGIMVYSGTGSVAYGMDAKGCIQKSGGWGHIIDDGGSGYDIGRTALQAAFKAYDGRGPQTSLLDGILEHFGCRHPEEIIPKIYRGDSNSRPQIAALAQLVYEQVGTGDKVAASILRTAANRLAELIIAVAAKLDLLERPVPVFTVGGVFNAGQWILDPLEAEVRKVVPHVIFKQPTLPPVGGALIIALKSSGVVLNTAIIKSLKEGLSNV